MKKMSGSLHPNDQLSGELLLCRTAHSTALTSRKRDRSATSIAAFTTRKASYTVASSSSARSEVQPSGSPNKSVRDNGKKCFLISSTRARLLPPRITSFPGQVLLDLRNSPASAPDSLF